MIWEDRARMNPKQQAAWDDEVKRYRAHVKEAIESEKKQKVDLYHFMMTNFDKDEKEAEAAMKKVQEREKAFVASKKESRTDQEHRQKMFDDLQKEKRDILKRQGEVIRNGQDPNNPGALTPEAEAEILELGNQLKRINQRSSQFLMETDPAYRTEQIAKGMGDVKPAHTPGAKGPEAASAVENANKPQVVRGKLPDQPPEKPKGGKEPTYPQSQEVFYKPHPAGKPVELRRNKTTGQLMGKMPDGSIVILEELPPV